MKNGSMTVTNKGPQRDFNLVITDLYTYVCRGDNLLPNVKNNPQSNPIVAQRL